MAARDARLPHRRGRLDGPRARRRQRGGRPARRHPRHLDRRQGAGRRRAAARRDDQDRPGHPRRRDRPQLRRRLGRRRGDGGARPGGSSRWPASRRTTRASGWAASASKQLSALYSDEGRRPAARPGDAGPVRARLDVEADQRGHARSTTASRPDTPAGLLVRACRSATGGSRTTSPWPTATSASPRPCSTPATRSSTASACKFWQQYGTDPTDVDARDPLVEGAKNFGFGRETGIDLPGEASGRIADRAVEARLLEVDEGLLLQDRRARTPTASATSCTSSPTSSASRATTTAPATR